MVVHYSEGFDGFLSMIFNFDGFGVGRAEDELLRGCGDAEGRDVRPPKGRGLRSAPAGPEPGRGFRTGFNAPPFELCDCVGGVSDFLLPWAGGDMRELEAPDCTGECAAELPTTMELDRSFWDDVPFGAARIEPVSGVAEGCFLTLSLSHRRNGSLTILDRFLIALSTLIGIPLVLSLTILVGLSPSPGSALARFNVLGGGGARLAGRLSPFVLNGPGAGAGADAETGVGSLATWIFGVWFL